MSCLNFIYLSLIFIVLKQTLAFAFVIVDRYVHISFQPVGTLPTVE